MFANLPPLVLVHFLAALVALPLGATQLFASKGTPVHRLLGLVYIPVMLVALLSALATYRPGTPFLFFHILALIGLGSLFSGTINLVRWLRGRDPSRLRAHMIDMAFSWLGLFMAGVSQAMINPRFGLAELTTGWRYWAIFAAINICLYAVGSWWIFRRLVPRAFGQQGSA